MGSDQPAEQKPPDFSEVDNILAIESNEFQSAFGESVANTLDINTWQAGEDLASMYQKLGEEVASAVEQGGRIRERVRAGLVPFVFERVGAAESAGWYKGDGDTIERIHRGLLAYGSRAPGTIRVTHRWRIGH